MPRWRVYIEGIALGGVVVEADTEVEALAEAAVDGDLNSLCDVYDAHAVSAEPLDAADGSEPYDAAL